MCKNGSRICLWDQPGPQSGELVPIRDCAGRLRAENRADGDALHLIWDAAALPHLLISIANPGLARDPRLPGFRGLGAEPVAAYLDSTPEGAAGVAITPDHPLTIRDAIECRKIGPEEGKT